LIANLLRDLAARNWNGGVDFEVIVTLNISEDETWLDQEYLFTIKVVRNDAPKGFGANHNSAFQIAEGSVFMVVNPDIRLEGFQVAPLLAALDQPATGVCGPRVVGPDGALQDSARRFPTVGRLLSRVLLRRRHPDFNDENGTISVDWRAGMFLMFPSDIFREIRGFDDRYFMYMEDVEICQNLWQRGFRVLWVSGTAVTHDARRASGRSVRHLRWHLTSMARYFIQGQRKI
jgi:GT2 family glycosyltransferase